MVRRGGERVEQGAAVERVNGVEQCSGLGRLVRLELADHVEANVGVSGAQGGPFVVRFLDPALAEVALPGGNQRLDLLDRAALRYRDQRDLGGVAAREPGGASDFGADVSETGCGITHAARYRKRHANPPDPDDLAVKVLKSLKSPGELPFRSPRRADST